MARALLIVDYQNDFLPGGELGVPDGHKAFFLLWQLAKEHDILVFTRDWHPEDHMSFAESTPEYTDGSWPPHCVQGTYGAEIDEDLWEYALDTGKPILLVHKGFEQDREEYSGFQGVVVDVFNREALPDDFDVDDLLWNAEADSSVYLVQALNMLGVTSVSIGGLALDYCVKATALDARAHYGDTTVYLNATRPVTFLTGAMAVVDLARQGVRLDGRES